MGYFSERNIDMQARGRRDGSYPGRYETLNFYMEDLCQALEARGVSVEELDRTARNGLIDYYDPRARYHYFSVLYADAPSIWDLTAAVGEVALRQKEVHRDEWQETVQVLPGQNTEPLIWTLSA